MGTGCAETDVLGEEHLHRYQERYKKFLGESSVRLSKLKGDVRCLVGSEKEVVDVQSFILCQHSPVFTTMLSLPMREGLEKEINLPSHDADCFRVVYNYLDKCSTKGFAKAVEMITNHWEEHAVGMLAFAREYEINHLTDSVCAAFLKVCSGKIYDQSELVAGDMVLYGYRNSNPPYLTLCKIQKCEKSKRLQIEYTGADSDAESSEDENHGRVKLRRRNFDSSMDLLHVDSRKNFEHLPRCIDVAMRFELDIILECLLLALESCCERWQKVSDLKRDEPSVYKELFGDEADGVELPFQSWYSLPDAVKYVVNNATFSSKYDILYKLASSANLAEELDKAMQVSASLVNVHLYYFYTPGTGLMFCGWDLSRWARAQLYRQQPIGKKFIDMISQALRYYWKGAQHEKDVEKEFHLGIFRQGSKKCGRFTEEQVEALTLDDLQVGSNTNSINLLIDWEGKLRDLPPGNEIFASHYSSEDGLKSLADCLNGNWSFASGKKPVKPETQVPDEPVNGPFGVIQKSCSNVDGIKFYSKCSGFPEGSFLILSNHWHKQFSCKEEGYSTAYAENDP